MLATVTWTGGGDGVSWNQGSNWDTGNEPGTADNALIPGSGLINVVGNNTTQSINGTRTLRIYGGRLTVTDGVSNVARVEVGRPGFFGPGSLRVSADMNATEVVQIGGTVDGGADLTVSGTYDWTSGTQAGAGDTVALGGMNISGEFDKTINGRRLITDGTTMWRIGGNEVNPGRIVISNGGQLHNDGVFNIQGDQDIANGGGSGSVVNDGTFRKGAGSGIASISRDFTNNGIVDAESGELRLNANFTNFSGSTLRGGTYLISDVFSFTGADIGTNDASIILNGGQIRDTNVSNALEDLDTNLGSLTTQNGANFSSTGDFDNEGTVTVGSGTTFSVAGDYNQDAGTTLIQENASLDPSGSFIINGGVLMGSGSVDSDVNNVAGEVSPGGSGGTLTIGGNYSQGSGGTLNVEIGGAYSITDVTEFEGQAAATTDFVFTVELSLPSSQAVTVDYATADGTARAPQDYVAASGTLTFNPGEVSKTITVTVNGDGDTEEDETFTVNLSNAGGGSSIGDPSGLGTIDNDDVDMSIDDVSGPEGNASGLAATDFVFTVSLHEPSPYTVTADYATADDSATVADSDYVATSGSLTFNPGETSKTITVQVTGDNKVEADEEFKVVLSNPVNATFPLVPGLLHYWPFDGDTQDIVGGRHGTLVGGATYSSGQVNQALDCSAATAYMNVPDPGPPGTTTLDLFDLGGQTASFVGWVNPNAHRGSDILINKENSYEIAIFGNGNIQWAFRNSSPGWAWIDTGFNIPLGSWTFFAVTYDNGVIRTFDESGTQQHVFNGSGIIGQVEADSDFRVCARGGDNAAGSLWQGHIDELAIYLPVLDPAQIPGVASDLRGTLAANVGTGTIQDDDGSSRASRDTVDDDSLVEDKDKKVKQESVQLEVAARQNIKPGFDQLNVAGTVTLGGTLNVLPAGGSNPDLGDQFRFLTYTSVSGSFSTENVNIGNGKAALTSYGATEGLLTISPPQITIDDVSLFEGDNGTTNAEFAVHVGESTVPITVDFATSDGTASAGSDYTAATGTVTFNPGETMQNITIAIAGDVDAEQDETFMVTLSNSNNAAILDNIAEGTIVNDDPRFVLTDVRTNEGNSGTTDLVFPIALSTPVAGQVTVDVATANGTGGEFEGVVSYWAGEGNANDLVGGRHGTLQGTAGFADGAIGQAFSFDGTAGGNVHVPDPGPPGSRNLDLTNDLTLSGWIYPATGITGQAIIINKESTYETARNSGTGTLQWAFQQAGGPGWVWVETGLALPLNTWTFYAMTYESGKIRTYNEDGTLFAPFDYAASLPLINNDNDLRLGARGGDTLTGSYWTGRLDEIRVYDEVLSVLEIRQLAAGGGVGAAFSPVDYTETNTTLTFAPGETLKNFTVSVQGDAEVEPDEKFSVLLSNPTGGGVLINDQAVGLIKNDETEVTLSIDNANINEDGGIARVTATLNAAVDFPVTVNLAFSGSATGGGVDYTASATQIFLEAGDTSGNVLLTAVQDPSSESGETIVVDIDDVANAVEAGGSQQVTTTIDDDDAPSAAVTGVVINDGQANRSGLANLIIQASDAVTVSGPDALVIWNHTTGAAVNLAGAVLSGNGTNALTWDLTGVSFDPGYHTATLPKSTGLVATHTELFVHQPGDSSGDGQVGFPDFGAVASNFNVVGGPRYGPGDMNGDTNVNFTDFGILSQNFNASQIAPDTDGGSAGGSFPTAQHITGSGLSLGASVGPDDGVAFGTLQAGDGAASITVNATVPGTATLNAFLDFNNDGDWDDPGEQIFVDQALSNGANALTAAIPPGAAVGSIQGRFRISSTEGYGAGGLAVDGEVEDYTATIVAARSAGRVVPSSLLDIWGGSIAEDADKVGKSGPAYSTVKPIRTDVVDQAIGDLESDSSQDPQILDDTDEVDQSLVDQALEETDRLLEGVL